MIAVPVARPHHAVPPPFYQYDFEARRRILVTATVSVDRLISVQAIALQFITLAKLKSVTQIERQRENTIVFGLTRQHGRIIDFCIPQVYIFKRGT